MYRRTPNEAFEKFWTTLVDICTISYELSDFLALISPDSQG